MFNSDQKVFSEENSSFQLALISVLGDRDDQQDCFGYALKKDEGIIVLCDGMGGHEGGSLASETAVDIFISRYNDNNVFIKQIDNLIETAKLADRKISELTDTQGRKLKAGSTLVTVIIDKNKLMWCSVGDSRAYLLRGNELVQLTQDHNYRTVLIEKLNAGLIDKKEFELESVRGEGLISYLGIKNLSLIDYSEIPLEVKKDDKIIIMTDGLYKLVSDVELTRILDNFSNINEAVIALEMKSKKNSRKSLESRDNMTVAIIKINGGI